MTYTRVSAPVHVDEARALDLNLTLPTTISIDLEVAGADKDNLHIPDGEVVLMTVSPDGNTVYYLTDHDAMRALLGERTWNAVFHNAAFDLRYLTKLGIDWSDWRVEDTYLAEKVLYSGWFDSFGLGALSARRLDLPMDKDIREEFAGGALTEEMIEYACRDAAATFSIWKQQQGEFNDRTLKAYRLDIAAMQTVLRFGLIPIDEEGLIALNEYNKARAAEALARMPIVDGTPLNPASVPQVKRYLNSLGLHLEKTDEETLRPYRERYPFVRDLLDYRDYSKKVSTYGSGILSRVSNGYLRAEFSVYGAETSRMSSRNPNMQNIPRSEEYRRLVRAVPGYKLVVADFSQQEVRIAAQYSQDPDLIALLGSDDIYTSVARVVYRNPKIDKHHPLRQHAKAVVLGMLYGLTVGGLARREKMDKRVAGEIIDRFFHEFPLLADWIRQKRALEKDTNFTYTLAGHRQYHNSAYWRARNNQTNSPVQGSGADMLKLAITKYPRPGDIIAVVHDEILLHVPESEAQDAADDLCAAMRWAHEELCPSVPSGAIESKICENWSEK